MNRDKISPFDNIKLSNPENIVERPSNESEDLTYEKEQWLMARIRSRMGEPYRPFSEIEIPLKWNENTSTREAELKLMSKTEVPDKDCAGVDRRIKGRLTNT